MEACAQKFIVSGFDDGHYRLKKKVGGFATGRRTNRQNATLRYKNVYAASWAIKEGVEKFHRNV